MNAIVLPPCQSDFSITPFLLPRFDDLQRGKEADEAQIKVRQDRAVFYSFLSEHDFVDNKIVTLSGHSANGVTHPSHCPSNHGPCGDGNGWLAPIFDRLEDHSSSMTGRRWRQHAEEGVHRNVQKGFGGNHLQLTDGRTFAHAADAVQNNDSGWRH